MRLVMRLAILRDRPFVCRMAIVAASACVFLIGCQRPPSGPPTYGVTGTVTLDGKPLASGDVMFYPETADMPAAWGTLKDGTFTLRAVAGRHRVEINALGGEPVTVSPIDPPIYKSIVPARYNTASTLTAEVSPTAPNQVEFSLESGKPGKR